MFESICPAGMKSAGRASGKGESAPGKSVLNRRESVVASCATRCSKLDLILGILTLYLVNTKVEDEKGTKTLRQGTSCDLRSSSDGSFHIASLGLNNSLGNESGDNGAPVHGRWEGGARRKSIVPQALKRGSREKEGARPRLEKVVDPGLACLQEKVNS